MTRARGERPVIEIRCSRLRGGVDVDVVRPGDRDYEGVLAMYELARGAVEARETEAFLARLRVSPWRQIASMRRRRSNGMTS